MNINFTKTNEELLRIDDHTSFVKTHIEFVEDGHPNIIQFGIDPGTIHIGFAYVYKQYTYLYEVTTKRLSNPVNRIMFMQSILTRCLGSYLLGTTCVVEGAAFGNNYRQVELAEVRASAVLWCLKYSIQPIIVPPTTIRKQVMGGGKIKPETVWKDLPPNAANALACALYRP